MLLGEPGGTEPGSVPCGQVWGCPVCAHAVRRARGHEAGLAADAHRRSGGRVWAVDCALEPAGPGQLAARWHLLPAAWRRVVSGSGWGGEGRRTRRAGVVWTPRVTWSEPDGWHLVLRVLLLDRAGREELHQDVVARWTAQWANGAGSAAGRVRWRPAGTRRETEDFMAAACDGSAGRRPQAVELGPADLLARARRTGAEAWWELWREYAEAAAPASRGHRSPVAFSRGVRSVLLPGAVYQTDAELAAEQGRATLPPLTRPAWSRLAEDGGLQLQVLDAAGRGPGHLAWFLDDHGLRTVEKVRLVA
ncbi:hypothetical protein ACFQ0M_48895 [Kitasatospora aburaviensis]